MSQEQKEHFVVRTGKELSVSGPFTESEAADEAAKGIGTINHIVKKVATVDRTNVLPTEVAEEAMTILEKILSGRRHSSSPQCLPVAQFRELERLNAQYKAAVAAQTGESDANF